MTIEETRVEPHIFRLEWDADENKLWLVLWEPRMQPGKHPPSARILVSRGSAAYAMRPLQAAMRNLSRGTINRIHRAETQHLEDASRRASTAIELLASARGCTVDEATQLVRSVMDGHEHDEDESEEEGHGA